MSGWTSVEERMPVKDAHVFVKTNKKNFYCGNCYYDDEAHENWIDACTYLALDEEITHWMTPEAPSC